MCKKLILFTSFILILSLTNGMAQAELTASLDTCSSDSGNWIMRRITAKLDFLTAMSVEVCHKIDNQPPNSFFCDHCG